MGSVTILLIDGIGLALISLNLPIPLGEKA